VIDLEWQGDVAVVRMRNGENRFNQASVAALHEILDELDAVEGPLALVTTGEGRFYSNGLDLDWMAANGDAAGPMVGEVHRLLGRVLGFAGYTVAAVNGHAFAGGAMLATAHDAVVMREDRGFWCLPEVDLGLPLTEGMHAVITARLPRRTAHEAMVTGKRYPAAEMLAAGIADVVVAEESVLTTAVTVAAAWAAKDRTVIARHKQLSHGEAIAVCGA
jgi:enoyl-CoA hydratase/carnithine racemase